MFFHGSEHKISSFTDEFVGGKEAHDQQGPGIYFTSSWKNARWYGPYVYTVKLKPGKAVSTQDGKKASAKELEWLIKHAPDWEMHAENFHENPAQGVKIAIRGILDYNDNPHQQFLQVWIDFYRNNPVDYVRNMVKLGYDIIYITGLESMVAGEANITHAIVLNPAIIEFVEMEDDRTDEEKAKDSLNEIRRFVRKTLQENEYRGAHVMRKDSTASPLYDLLQSGQVAKDFYDEIHHYAYLNDPTDKESVRVIRYARNKPDAIVTIYRAVPKGVKEINPGDWVSLSKLYAKEHGMHHEDSKLDMPVISKKVKAKDVWWDGNDVNEFSYFPEAVNENESLNDNFWKWFAGSKVVDSEGSPLVVHHGTSKKFSVFSLKKAPQKIIWFTSNKSSVEAGEVGAAGHGHIMDLYASIKNPAGWDEYEKYGLGQLRDLGYDGAILPDPDGSITGFVFDSNQLKSVKNKGGWDMSQKNIYKEVEKFDSGKFPVPEYKPGELKSKFSDDYDLSKHNFNHGDCDIYAVALHRLYGYPLYVVRGWFLEPEWGGEREWDYEDSHIVVKLPNGNYMDSNGETTEMELRQNCAFSNDIAKITFEPLSEADALATFSCQDQEADVKQIMKYINSKNIQEVRGPSKYVNCHLSDLIRMDKIEEFLNEIEKNPEYNTEEPEYDWLMDPHGGYPEQTYIQNKLENGEIVFWEGWSSYCWKGLYSKPEYKGLSKENALKKIFRERTPRIAQEFDMTIKDADFFWHDAGDDDAENGYIMKIVFRLK